MTALKAIEECARIAIGAMSAKDAHEKIVLFGRDLRIKAVERDSKRRKK